MLDRVGLANRSEHKPQALSGGQCQRVAIARALIGNPAVILADEPTAALDTENALDVMKLFRRLAHDDGRIVVMVSHDQRLEKFADRVLRMEDGRLMSTRTEGSRPRIPVPEPVATALENAAGLGRSLPPGDGTRPETAGALRADLGQGRIALEGTPRTGPDRVRRLVVARCGEECGIRDDVAGRSAAGGPDAASVPPWREPGAPRSVGGMRVAAPIALRRTSRGRLERGAGPRTERESRSVTALGKVEARQGSMNLSITLPGILARVYVEEGQWFEKGQLLAELINDDLIARVDIATHELTQAEARLELLALGSRKEEIDEARAQVEGLNAQRAYLSNLKRMREQLFSRRAASKEEVLEIQSRADVNTKELEAATARWERLKVGPRQQEIAGAEAAVRVARAASRGDDHPRTEPAQGAPRGVRLAAPSQGRRKRFRHRSDPRSGRGRPARARNSRRGRREPGATGPRRTSGLRIHSRTMRALPWPGRSDASPAPWAGR